MFAYDGCDFGARLNMQFQQPTGILPARPDRRIRVH